MKTAVFAASMMICTFTFQLRAQNRSSLYQLANKSAFLAISRYCERLSPELNVQSELLKQHILLSDGRASVALMLLEFIEGNGPEYRTLHQDMQYVKRFMESPGWALCCKYFLGIDTAENLLQLRYQFSPVLFPPNLNSWIFSAQQHQRVLKAKQLEQLFLGSFDVWAQKNENELWQFTVYNRTSRKSLFLTIPKRVKRPMPLGTVHQVLIFEMSQSQMEELEKSIP